MVEKLLRLARVFAGDAVGLLEDIKGAECDIPKIADGRGYEVKAGGEFF